MDIQSRQQIAITLIVVIKALVIVGLILGIVIGAHDRTPVSESATTGLQHAGRWSEDVSAVAYPILDPRIHGPHGSVLTST
jgi:hypothetical protein